MAKILVIEGNKVTPLTQTKFTEEGKLQDYLEEYPSLIPVDEIVERASDLLCIGREVSVPPGSIDLLFIDENGLLTIVETKLAKNPEARRTVIGQIIEYASYIAEWAADDVYRVADDYFSKSDKVPSDYKGCKLSEAMEKFSGSGFIVEDFTNNIEQNLRNGKGRLMIAVDELAELLRATVTFLNRNSNFDIVLLQVKSFEESTSRKVLIPSLFGYTSPPPTSGPRKQWDEKSFFDDVSEKCSKEIAQAIKELYKFSEENAAFRGWGTGTARGSFIFHGVEQGLSIFVVYSDGEICNTVGGAEAWNRLDKETLKDFWASELSQKLEINFNKDQWFIIHIDDLVKRNKVDAFHDAVLALCHKISSSK